MATALQTLGLIRISKKVSWHNFVLVSNTKIMWTFIQYLLCLQVGEKDQIFGSVQAQEITQYIEQQTSRKLDHRDVTLPEIKSLGTYEASIKLHPEVTGYFKIQVTKQAN